MAAAKTQPDNPADREGVAVFRPRKLANTSFDSKSGVLLDLETGDLFQITRYGHAGGPGGFKFSNEKTGPIAGGTFTSWEDSKTSVFQVTSIGLATDGFRALRSREEYSISRLAELVRARREAVYHHIQPLSKVGFQKEVLVVDARPATIRDINPVTGLKIVK